MEWYCEKCNRKQSSDYNKVYTWKPEYIEICGDCYLVLIDEEENSDE